MLRIMKLIAIVSTVLLTVTLSVNAATPTSITEASADLSTNYIYWRSSPAYADYQYTFVVDYNYLSTTDASPAENVVCTILLPEDTLLIYAKGHGDSNGIYSTLFPEVIDGNQLIWNLGTLYENDSGEFEVTVHVPVDAIPGPPLTVQASITSTTPDPDLSNNTWQHQQSVEQVIQDLVVNYERVVGGGPGSQIDFMTRIRRTNTDLPTKGLIVTQTLAPELSYLGWSGCIWSNHCEEELHHFVTPTISGQTVEWRLPDMPEYYEIRIYTVTRADPTLDVGDVVSTSTSVSNLLHDPDLSNNNAYTTTHLTDPYLDGVLGIGLGSIVRTDELYTYSIYGRNDGTLPFTNTVLSTLIPEGFTYVSSSGQRNFKYTGWFELIENEHEPIPAPTIVNERQLTWSLPTIWAEDEFYVSITSAPDPNLQSGDSIESAASLSAHNFVLATSMNTEIDIPDPEPSVELYDKADLELWAGDVRILLDREIPYTLQIVNPPCDPYEPCLGDSPVYDVVVTDTLPAGIIFKSGYAFARTSPLAGSESITLTPTINGQVINWEIPYIPLASWLNLYTFVEGTNTLSIGDTLSHPVSVWHAKEIDPSNNQAENAFLVVEPEVSTDVYTFLDPVYLGVRDFYSGPGGKYRLAISVESEGDIPAENLTITNTLSSRVTFTGWEAQLSYRGVITDVTDLLSVQALGNEIVWNAGTLVPHAELKLHSYGVVDDDLMPGTVLQFNVAVHASQGNISTDATNLTISHPEADLSIAPYARTYAQSDTTSAITLQTATSVRYVPTGSDLTYAITIDNPANSAMRGVIATATVPDGTTYISAACDGLDSCVPPTLDGNTLTWDLDTIPALNAITLYPTIHIPSSMESGLELSSDVILETVDPDWYYHNNYATTTVTTFNADSWLYLPIVSK